jgi:hypothetical protein
MLHHDVPLSRSATHHLLYTFDPYVPKVTLGTIVASVARTGVPCESNMGDGAVVALAIVVVILLTILVSCVAYMWWRGDIKIILQSRHHNLDEEGGERGGSDKSQNPPAESFSTPTKNADDAAVDEIDEMEMGRSDTPVQASNKPLPPSPVQDESTDRPRQDEDVEAHSPKEEIQDSSSLGLPNTLSEPLPPVAESDGESEEGSSENQPASMLPKNGAATHPIDTVEGGGWAKCGAAEVAPSTLTEGEISSHYSPPSSTASSPRASTRGGTSDDADSVASSKVSVASSTQPEDDTPHKAKKKKKIKRRKSSGDKEQRREQRRLRRQSSMEVVRSRRPTVL